MTTVTTPAPTPQSRWRDRAAPLVVGVDGGEESDRALDWAVAEVVARGGRMVIVHAWDWSPWYHRPTGEDAQIEKHLEDHGRTVLEQARARAVAGGVTDVATMIKRGDGPSVLTDAGGDSGLVIVGTRHLPAVSRIVLGSVSSGIVATARCPVIVISNLGQASDPRGRVVIGLAGGDRDEPLLAFGFAYAERHRLPVLAILCHAPIPGDISLPSGDRYEQRAAEVVAPWQAAYPTVEARGEGRRSHAVDALVAAATGGALLVVGRNTGRRLIGPLVGSVAAGVLHHATSPVAVIPIGTEPSRG